MVDFKASQTAPSPSEITATCRPELGDLVVEYLEGIGVEYIFGVPGGAIEPLYNAMARSSRRGGLRPIIARHEAGAAFMADGYARETGKLGVCCATTGPGATNLITGVASAYADNIPMLVLTAQTALPQFGRRTLQESSCTAVNTVAMFQACTRFSSLVSHRGQLEGKLLSAILATQGPPAGPAHLSIPMDVLASPRRLRSDAYMPLFNNLLNPHDMTNLQAMDALYNEVAKSPRIVVILGEDCGGAMDVIMEFIDAVHAIFVSGPAGKRHADHHHPLYRGTLGFAGHESASQAVNDAEVDLVLAVGTRMDDLVFGSLLKSKAFQEKLVQIDVTAENFHLAPLAHLHVCGTIQSIFKNLLAQVREHCCPRQLRLVADRSIASQNTEEACNASRKLPPPRIHLNEAEKFYSNALPLKPQRLMHELSRRFPAHTRFIADAGNSWTWSIHYLMPQGRDLYRVAMGYGAMAWGIGAAVGTAIGCPGAPVVCLTGDGSWLMSGQELTVAVAEKLPVIYVMLNDGALGMVKHGQRLGGAEPVGFELPPVDFAGMARAMGAEAYNIRSIADLDNLDIEQICRRQGPTLLDVIVDGEEVPPMGMRMKNLGR
ncbi:thiamine pyrophosphate-binding protein [Geoalkalibacter halelectricus]|uniref:thiamine pyrophosphate-binding protein n=1 Tax=Geoalkalibacter halelectricus TaxID=2847045 RepID=UPI00266EB1F4|nr:thiamine pyrophosphate-binding protein [Geoalkalibacter halelectricus]MDO3380083.1 thiamine pyrophosphate-binding protein [Geoalkalibacter halelectricus]